MKLVYFALALWAVCNVMIVAMMPRAVPPVDPCAGMSVERVSSSVTVCYAPGTDLGHGIKSNWSPK